jgi:DNA-binding MarR family transcriptional regulator
MASDTATQLLLAFSRLLRGKRQEGALPSQLHELVHRGDLAPRHLGALAIVAIEGPLTVSELARREGLALTTASLLVSQLAEAGLVERREDAADRRRTVVSIAPEHRKESAAVLEGRLAPLRRALDRLGPDRAAVLLEGLEIVTEELEATP